MYTVKISNYLYEDIKSSVSYRKSAYLSVSAYWTSGIKRI